MSWYSLNLRVTYRGCVRFKRTQLTIFPLKSCKPPATIGGLETPNRKGQRTWARLYIDAKVPDRMLEKLSKGTPEATNARTPALLPFPLPIRTLAGFRVTGRATCTFTQNLRSVLTCDVSRLDHIKNLSIKENGA
jgi:hypothetical protein